MSTPEALKLGDLRVWWVPQVPGKLFTVAVTSREQGRWLCDVLADYDKFQYDENVKGDYCNAGGVQRLEDDGDGGMDWFDISDDEDDED